ncbi:sulfur-oxidizing protein SoxY [Persephonella hydrogeniphila]|uniref:Sulfur-oxidizing protein SoxY n=1 Tax=Persephonella hydrogeniphila TaxID=198703 RepID=A0A285NG33_9AQUI|nr:thiosulfate oxidation carrier protein SoxY [Persephonella hydrogeniphila]SNZ06846.1 sulfur-oxidizing protein SoxY [Persephonella hydrogeniphila]
MNRRKFLKMTAVAGAVVAVSPSIPVDSFKVNAQPKKRSFEDALKEITKGKTPVEAPNEVKLIAPSIAENGAVVPIKVEVKKPIKDVKAIHILADKNFDPWTCSVHLTPQNGKPYFATRIRLAKTMNVYAVAELSDGSFIMTKKPVKVTIGGCG